MSNRTEYLEHALINAVLRNTTYTSQNPVYVALFTVAPTDTTTGTEVSGNAYARQSVAFDAPVGGVTQNTSLITFPTATGNWGSIVAIAICDQLTGGNQLYYTSVTSTPINDTDTATIAAAAISITET